jgi:hypothetical protein
MVYGKKVSSMGRMQIIDRDSIKAKEAIQAVEDRLIFDSLLRVWLDAEGLLLVKDEMEFLPGATCPELNH